MSQPISTVPPDGVIHLRRGEGRHYALGAMQAVFLADEEETRSVYSISEWWLDPHTPGPGAHSHEANDDIFYVLEGTMTFLVGERTVEATRGDFIRVPAGTTHDFGNRHEVRAGVLNIYIPGGFEREMAGIVAWFAQQGGASAR
jgi:mannose-6-phosphate isomerase-like protein (cupin superfamily)